MAVKLRFSPADKAAILLVALGEEIAADLFKAMDPHEVRVIAAAINRLGKLDKSVIDEVLVEFLSILHDKSVGPQKDPAGFAQRALQLAFKGEQGQRLAQQIGKGAVKLRALEVADSTTLARVLLAEHPQTVAMVLAYATAEKASQVLRQMPESLRTEILLRIAKLSSIDLDIVAEIDQHLLTEIEKMGSLNQRKIGGAKKAAEILNSMDKNGLEILRGIESRSSELSEEIRQEMFTFEDLAYLDNRGLQELVKSVARNVLIMALRGVDEKLLQLFFRSMSERAAKIMRDDIEALGSQKQSAVQSAQREVLDHVQKLEAEGKIVIERQKNVS